MSMKINNISILNQLECHLKQASKLSQIAFLIIAHRPKRTHAPTEAHTRSDRNAHALRPKRDDYMAFFA